MIKRRVNDGSVLRLIQKWIKVGAIDNGKLLVSETGTGQGQPISPLLANVYLLRVALRNRYYAECIVTQSVPQPGRSSRSFGGLFARHKSSFFQLGDQLVGGLEAPRP